MRVYGYKFIIKDRERYPLPGSEGRATHLATITCGLREYLFFYLGGTTYVEEISGGSLIVIKDDPLWIALTKFIEENKLSLITEKQ